MILKPVSSEKAVKMIDRDNTLIFKVEKREKRDAIKKEVETVFSVKVDKVRTCLFEVRAEHRVSDIFLQVVFYQCYI